jgi:hypothetical integral membrane protein (TIGR02206 family)
MHEMVRYFFGEGTQPEFSLFTLAHFAPILVAAALIFLIFRFRKPLADWKYEYTLRYALAFILIISEMGYYWRLVGMPALGPNPFDNLPIAACGWAAIFLSYAVIGKSQTLFDFCYFWLFSGSLFALITPTLEFAGPTRFRYYQFWTEHLSIYVALFYLMFVHKMRPTVRSAVKSYIALAVMAVVAYCTNVYLGGRANYLFLAKLPSLLDILPDITALRIGVMAAVITVMYFLAYLPWYIKDRKASKQPVAQ